MRGKQGANGVYLRLKRACDAPDGAQMACKGLVRAFDEGQGDGFEFIQDSLKRAETGLFRAFLLGCGSLMVTIW